MGTLEKAKQELVTLGLYSAEEADRIFNLPAMDQFRFLMEAPPGITVQEWREQDRRGNCDDPTGAAGAEE
jgi:hypothetical protein